LPGELLESELFGYERGAFTGALRTKTGKFELGDKGTILLDEVAEMPANLQAKLLHVRQDKRDRVLSSYHPALASSDRGLFALSVAGQLERTGKLCEPLPGYGRRGDGNS
jgi:transcriptional regulator with AAA-type ATPase domain